MSVVRKLSYCHGSAPTWCYMAQSGLAYITSKRMPLDSLGDFLATYEDEDDNADKEDDKASELFSGGKFRGTWDTDQV